MSITGTKRHEVSVKRNPRRESGQEYKSTDPLSNTPSDALKSSSARAAFTRLVNSAPKGLLTEYDRAIVETVANLLGLESSGVTLTSVQESRKISILKEIGATPRSRNANRKGKGQGGPAPSLSGGLRGQLNKS